MNLSEPSESIVPTLDGPVLMVLARSTRPLAAREVARLVRRGSWGGVRTALRRLAEQGVLTVLEAGNSTLYTLNREHLAAPAVEVLAGLREELVRKLSEAIASWNTQPVHVSLFGSAARGDGDVTSDVDLFVVRPSGVQEDDPAWRDQLDRIARDVLDWTGNHVGVAEVGIDELAKVHRTSTGRAIREEGVTLFGPNPAALWSGAR